MIKITRLPEPIKRWDWPLIGLFLFGLILRCINLSTRSIQYDDAFSLFLARKDWQTIIEGTAADTMPPLYYFLLHIWQWVSQDIGWLRLLSILLNLAGIYFLHRIVELTTGRKAGLFAVFFAAISPLQIYHAQDLRMYALLATAQLGYLYFFLRVFIQEHFKPKMVCGFILFGAAAMYSHNLAVFTLLVPDVFLAFRRDWRALKKLLITQAVIALLALPWLLMVPGQVEKIQRSFWTPQPGLVEVLQAVIVMTTNLPLDGVWLPIGVAISLELAVLIAWELIRKKPQQMGFLIWAFLLPPVLLFGVSYLMRPVFVPRGFLTSATIYLALAGIVVAWSRTKVVKGLILAGFSAAALIALPYQLNYSSFPRSDFSTAMQSIRMSLRADEVIIHDNKLSFFPSHYYAPDLPQVFLADEPGSPNDTYAEASQQAIGLIPSDTLTAAIGNFRGVRFVVFQTTLDEYQIAGFSQHPVLKDLSLRFDLMDETTIGDLVVFSFR